jgi:hypothetical protein
MAKYGWFAAGSTKPYDTYEGDYMLQNGEHVQIKKTSVRTSDADAVVAVISLRPGESVREMK